jgi:glutathione-regulated potassium-efflux system ancillary protein KefF
MVAAGMARILVVTAHPQLQQSRVTRTLLKAARGLEGPGGAGVEVTDLYAAYPDYLIDVRAEQRRLADAELVVWLHPIQWYSMPPLMKLWLDEVFAFGWAYGAGGKALRGKALWLACSTGGTEDAYRPDGHNRYFFDAFLHPYEQTAALCGMRWLPPLVMHGAHRATAADIAAHAQLFTERLASWPRWPELAELDDTPECAVPGDARPAQA